MQHMSYIHMQPTLWPGVFAKTVVYTSKKDKHLPVENMLLHLLEGDLVATFGTGLGPRVLACIVLL